jgi:hypothetical protein
MHPQRSFITSEPLPGFHFKHEIYDDEDRIILCASRCKALTLCCLEDNRLRSDGDPVLPARLLFGCCVPGAINSILFEPELDGPGGG